MSPSLRNVRSSLKHMVLVARIRNSGPNELVALATGAHATSRAQPLPPNNSIDDLHVQVCSCNRSPPEWQRILDVDQGPALP